MAATIPPIVPPVDAGSEPPGAWIHVRIRQIFLCVATLGATAWLWRIHPIAGIAAAFLAKHILVAVLASGLRTLEKNDPPESSPENSPTYDGRRP